MTPHHDTRPRKLGAQIKHLWLAHRMAKRTGVDLCTAYEAGDLTQEDWKALVEKCRGCQWTDGCQRFLTRSCESLQPIPQTCENQSTLVRLQNAAKG